MVTIASRLKYKYNMYMEIINLCKCQSSVSDILFMYYPSHETRKLYYNMVI